MRIPGIPYVQGRNAYTDRDGHKYGIAIHNTSNDASAEAEASYATRRTDGISAHLYCDADSVVQSLDTDSRAGHAGSYEGNEHAIAVEITGVNGWTRQQWLDRVAWAKLGGALAYLCAAYGIAVRRASVAEMQSNPKVKAFYSHDDMRRAWGKTTHTDVGPNFPWDRLFQAVTAAGEDDDMQLTDSIKLVTGGDIDYSSPTTTVAGVLASTNYYVLQTRNRMEAGQRAILAAVQGVDTDAVIAAVNARADEDARRDAELLDLVRQAEIGGATAAEIAALVAANLAARLQS